jgi:hypothetical protein
LILVGVLGQRDSLGRIAIDAGLLLVGAFADRVRRAKVGPSGAEIELDQRSRESTTELSVRSTEMDDEAAGVPVGDRVVDVHRVALANDVISFLTHPSDGPLVGCSFQLYLFDANEEMLQPVLPPGHAGSSPALAAGEGVAGKVWETGEFAIAEGVETSDETFSLSPDKRSRYSDLAVVAAMPVTNAAGGLLAVLAASSTDQPRAFVKTRVSRRWSRSAMPSPACSWTSSNGSTTSTMVSPEGETCMAVTLRTARVTSTARCRAARSALLQSSRAIRITDGQRKAIVSNGTRSGKA